jgi:ATP-binding cassette subfamily B protein RaxB
MMACFHGYDMDLASARTRFGTSIKGSTLSRLLQVATQMGLAPKPLRAELDYLPSITGPCILHWDMVHFVVLRRVSRKGAEIFDPARGTYTMPLEEVSKHFTGILVELSPDDGFVPDVQRRSISLRSLTGTISGLKRGVAQLFGLALAIELLALLIPIQAQWVLDQVVVSQDVQLLAVVSGIFVLVVGIHMALGIARAYVITWLGATINVQWISNLFRHLMRLPMSYFERRHMGDIVSRFSSAHVIQATITGSFVEAVLDGLTGCLTLFVLVAYSPILSIVVLTGLLVYGALRWFNFQGLRLINEEQIIYGARQQSELMESIRGIESIKLANKNSERSSRLASATMEATERDMRSQRLGLIFGAVNQGVFGLQRIALIALGVWLTIKGSFTIGMLVAYLAYAEQFTTKAGRLVDKAVEFRMLRMHGERLADIALEDPERHLRGSWKGDDPSPVIEVHGLGFRYAVDEPWIFQGLDLKIQAGEYVAITGPSGCGKTTLAKLILGLLEPSEGSITVGGVDIRVLGLERYRGMVSAVMQDAQLFAGTISENITFFENDPQQEQVFAAAMQAMIHDDVVKMPMRYDTLVGDMGSALSGGQRQRVLIARALYAQPQILLLDEATSHLDTAREQHINVAIDHLRMTRISIAHRPETIASADRVIELS